MDYLKAHSLNTIEDLDTAISNLNQTAAPLRRQLKQNENRMRAIAQIKDAAAAHAKLKPIHDTFIKKNFKLTKDAYAAQHKEDCQKDRLELLFLFFPLFCSRPAGNSPRIRLLFPKIYLPWFCLFPVLPLWTTLLLPPGIRLPFPSSGLHPRQQKHFHCQKDHLCSPQDPFILKQAMDSKKSSCSRRKNCHKYSDGYGHCL